MTKPNRDYLLATIASLRNAHESLSLYIDSDHSSEDLKEVDVQICHLARELHGRPELEDIRKHLRGTIDPLGVAK